MRKAVAAAPQAIFEHMGFHRNLLEQGYAGDLLEAAAIALPVEAFNNIAEYKDMPYAMRVLTAAAKQNPDAAYRYLENNYGKTPPFANAVKAAADSASRDNEIKL